MTALRQRRGEIFLSGRGGPRMREAGGESVIDWSQHSAVLGLWEVMKNYGYFRQQFAATLREVKEQDVDAVILIDYPGFNLRLARALRSRYPRLKLIYYISPQVWAWNRRRIPQMAKQLDLMLCIFPFEVELYQQSRLRASFVGHPMIEALKGSRRQLQRDPSLIGLFPGSRLREVRKILPCMMRAAEHILAAMPDARFVIAAASARLANEIDRMLSASPVLKGAVEITTSQASEAMQRATAGIVASGTATLEAAYFRLPIVVVYQVAWLTYFVARLVVKVKYLGMPNVLAGREIVPEFIQHRAD
ncbi:MAG: lipid-A-disaccharide synthase, partial [Verrucomicrobiota bacterium]|nr:lipid-A-disaccharide synthase [Verrucomicrobiota bacterium]